MDSGTPDNLRVRLFDYVYYVARTDEEKERAFEYLAARDEKRNWLLCKLLSECYPHVVVSLPSCHWQVKRIGVLNERP